MDSKPAGFIPESVDQESLKASIERIKEKGMYVRPEVSQTDESSAAPKLDRESLAKSVAKWSLPGELESFEKQMEASGVPLNKEDFKKIMDQIDQEEDEKRKLNLGIQWLAGIRKQIATRNDPKVKELEDFAIELTNTLSKKQKELRVGEFFGRFRRTREQ